MLPEKAAVLETAFTTMTRGVFDFDEGSTMGRVMVAAIKFFKKYDCQSCLNQVGQYVLTHCEGFWEVLPRFLAAIYLERDDLCADMVERYRDSIKRLVAGDFLLVPYKLFTLIPGRYYWALAAARLEESGKVKVGRCSGTPSERFTQLLSMANESEEVNEL